MLTNIPTTVHHYWLGCDVDKRRQLYVNLAQLFVTSHARKLKLLIHFSEASHSDWMDYYHTILIG